MASLLLSRRDLDFLLYEWLDVEALTKRDAATPTTRRETFDAVLDLARADRDRALRAAQPQERRQRAALRRRARAPDPGGRRRRSRSSPRPACSPARSTRSSAGCSCPTVVGSAVLRLVPGGQRRHAALPVPHHRQRQPAAGARHAGAGRDLRPADARGPLLRHDVPVRAAGRLVAGRRHDARRAAGRRHLPAVRQQDVDLGRRARAVREHRPPRARQDPRRTGRGEGHLAVHRAQGASSRPASATTSCWPA